jgi:general L-amino acid transport system permease protein
MNVAAFTRNAPAAYIRMEEHPNLPPPASVKPSWPVQIFRAYLGTPANAVITIGCVLVLAWLLPALLNWAVFKATWTGNAETCRANGGACWSFVREKFWFSVFGLYPFEMRWRPAVVLLLFAAMVAISMQRSLWSGKLVYAWVAALVVMWTLMGGSVPVLSSLPVVGPLFQVLPTVQTRLWGGWLVTIFLAVFGLAMAYPIGIVLALGRRSDRTFVRLVCVIWIEFIRGVPLISLLFIGTFIVPLFMPTGVELDRFIRAQIAFIMFAAAYMAEVFRGGLQAIPKGQYEGADSLGLSYTQKIRLVVLPQALKITIPAQVNTFIGLFKDTTLVLIIGIFDFFTTLRSALGDANWLGFATEAYVYAAVVYFICCYGMSRYSRHLEVVLNEGQRR